MKKNVLVFPCGSEIGLEVHNSLRFVKDIELIGASSVDDHGMYVYQDYVGDMPNVDSDKFIEKMEALVISRNVDFIMPAHDSVVSKLSQNRSKFSAKVVTSSNEICEIARSKSQTYEKLKSAVNTPEVFTKQDILEYPVFLKPDVGQGSKGVMRAESDRQVNEALRKDPSLLVLEYLPGDEYTVDCFTDRHGKLLYAEARTRQRVTNGISVNSRAISGVEFKQFADRINDRLKFRGVWFFQVKRDRHMELTLLEIAPRVAGTMSLSRIRGVNLPLLSIYDAMDIDVGVLKNDFCVEVDRALNSVYKIDIRFDKVYIDFDDTIIIGDRLNYLIISLLFKFKQDNKQLALITRHTEVVEDTLAEYNLSINLFDEIIHITNCRPKSEHIRANSIFIDDSYAERKEVLESTGVPVFDVGEAIAML